MTQDANPDQDAQYLEEVIELMVATELELEAKGYPEKLTRNAVERARGIAEYKTSEVRPSLRTVVFRDIIEGELRMAEVWAARQQSYFDTEG